MKQITVTNFVGAAPFNVYLCDTAFNNCIWITNGSTVPVVFPVPAPYDANTEFGVRITDNNNCTFDQVISL
jgi:hypothetical protein